MNIRRVEFTPEAEADLVALCDYIAAASYPETAIGYLTRLEDFCMGLAHASERGSLRNDVRKGLRVIGFERRINIAFVVEAERVVILRLFYGGRNWQDSLE